MNKINLLILLFSIELGFFVISIGVYVILLHIIKNSSKERLIRLLSGRQEQSLGDIKEKILKSIAKLNKIKIELFIVIGIAVISLLCLWYLSKAQSEFFLLGIMIIIPLPFCILFLEYFFKKVTERIKELANL